MEGLREMSDWLRLNLYSHKELDLTSDLIQLLSYYLQELQATFEYFDQAAAIHNLADYPEAVRSEFR
jgi:hypothetical protein